MGFFWQKEIAQQKVYTPSPVFSFLRATNHWMFEARFERSVTRRQHRVAPPTINRTSHFS